MRKQEECQLVMIEWEDSTQPQGRWQWLSGVETPKIVRCLSVGFMIRDTDEVKTLAPNLGNVDCDGDVQASGLISIPTRAVLRICKIREVNNRSSSAGPSRAPSGHVAASKHLGAATPRKRRVRESQPR